MAEMTLDKNQAQVHRNFGSDSWLGNKKHVEQLITWVTFFRRNLHRFAQSYLGLPLHPYQSILLYLMGISEMFVWIAARSCAKSFVIAIYACCKAILYPNCKIVLCSSTRGQARLIAKEKILRELMGMSPALCAEIEIVRDNQNETVITFKSGSTITVVPAIDSSRGNRAQIVVYEEFRQIDKKVMDEIISPFLITRPAAYMIDTEYSNMPELIEEPKQVFISSSWFSSHYMYNIIKQALSEMYRDRSAYLIGMDYSITLKHNIKTRRFLQSEKKKFDQLSFEIEYCNFMPRENTSAFFSYDSLIQRQRLKQAFYPRKADDNPRSKNRYAIPKQDGEVRVVSVDVAMMDGKLNDNSVYYCLRLLPETTFSIEENHNQFGYRVQAPYIEAYTGKDALRQVIRIKQLMFDFEADYLVLDIANAGISIYDLGARVIYDDERGIEYPPWCCMNNEEVAKRINSGVDTPNVYAVSASQKFNSDIAFNLRQMLFDGKLDLLVNANEAAEELSIRWPEYLNGSAEDQLRFESPYLETMLTIKEASELECEKLEQTGAVRLRERSGARKDRYTALSYGCWFASELGRDMDNDEDFDYTQLEFFASSVDF